MPRDRRAAGGTRAESVRVHDAADDRPAGLAACRQQRQRAGCGTDRIERERYRGGSRGLRRIWEQDRQRHRRRLEPGRQRRLRRRHALWVSGHGAGPGDVCQR